MQHSYAYDNVGNRVTADGFTYTSNALNQYTQAGGMSFTYDGQGNLTGDGTDLYGYDADNRLTSATAGAVSGAYQFDAFGRRVKKSVTGTGGGDTQYIYDGDEVIAEYDGGGALAAEYVTGAGLDEVLLMDRGGARYYYVHDGLGSVTGLSDGAGTVLETYDYDPYGALTTPASALGNPYYFTSRRLDDETGLYHYRARAYDAGMGRFLQRDPIGYWDSMNLYTYVGNDPVNWVDPWGLATLHYWAPQRRGSEKDDKWYGHVSLSLDDGTYISYWPSRPLGSNFDSTPPRPPDYNADLLGEGGRSSVNVDIRGLDEKAIKDWWDNTDHGDFSALNNCSDIVSQSLRKGGFDIPLSPIYHPEQVYNDVQNLLNQGWPNVDSPGIRDWR